MSILTFNKFLSGIQEPPSITAAVFPNHPRTKHAFLPMAGLIPRKMDFPWSKNAMNLDDHTPKVKVVCPGLISPNDIVLDVRLETFRRPRAPIKRSLATCPESGWIRLHGVWLGYFDSAGTLIMIRRYKKTDIPELIELEKAKLTKQLNAKELEYLKVVWFNNDNSGLEFMAHQGLKHSSYFCDEKMEHEQLPDYYRKVHTLASRFFDGGEKDIRNVLYNSGLRLGEYYNGLQLSEDLKKAYGEYPCIRFKKEDGHPVLSDITMLYINGEEPQLLRHPKYREIPNGEFLFRSVDF